MSTGILAKVCECPKCGDVWHVHQGEAIDPENDEVHTLKCCAVCGSEVFEKKINNIQVMHDLTEEEMQWLQNSDENE